MKIIFYREENNEIYFVHNKKKSVQHRLKLVKCCRTKRVFGTNPVDDFYMNIKRCFNYGYFLFIYIINFHHFYRR